MVSSGKHSLNALSKRGSLTTIYQYESSCTCSMLSTHKQIKLMSFRLVRNKSHKRNEKSGKNCGFGKFFQRDEGKFAILRCSANRVHVARALCVGSRWRSVKKRRSAEVATGQRWDLMFLRRRHEISTCHCIRGIYFPWTWLVFEKKIMLILGFFSAFFMCIFDKFLFHCRNSFWSFVFEKLWKKRIYFS